LASALLPKSFAIPNVTAHSSAPACEDAREARFDDPEARNDRESRPGRSCSASSTALESAIKRLTWKPGGTEWSDYYQDTNYSSPAMERQTPDRVGLLDATAPKLLGHGRQYRRIHALASDRGIDTIAFDIDPGRGREKLPPREGKGREALLPLLMD